MKSRGAFWITVTRVHQPLGAVEVDRAPVEASGGPRDLQARRALTDSVVGWFRENGRVFPWRGIQNPYHVLIAEVLLRQTQALRVVAPYLDMIAKYPDPESLAQANVPSLRWRFRTLGLVSRADRLVECARILVQEHGGQVPQGLRELEALPGLGRYSARAVLCLAYGQAVPLIDEGSGRVLRRVLGQSVSGPSYASRPLMRAAEEIVPESSAAEFSLGLIDIAARFCRPRTSLCSECPLATVSPWARWTSASRSLLMISSAA